MSTTGHESEAINVSGLKASLQKLKTDHIDKKYVKPSTGIPKGDLASDVQTSLGKADTALQSHQDISGKADKTTTVNGHALSADVTVSKSDVGLGNVTDDAQVKRSEMGVANGIATLDSAGKVPSSQLPSYVDDVLEYDTKSAFPETGESGKVYVDKSTNTSWRWSGTTYVQIKGDLAIGNTSGTAADGGIANTHYSNTSNPHSVTKAQVGLGSVVNTGDSATPVAGGTTKFTTGGAYTELNKKVDKVDGKGLSTNDYTTDEKNKLAGIDTRIANAASTAKTEVIGGATSDYNTLGKIEDKLSPIETAIEDCAYLENGDSSAAIADFDPQADSLWKKQQTLSAAEKVQVQQNIGVREWLNNLTGEKFASVTATDQTTSVTSLLPATGATDTVYRVGMWDGTQYNEEYYSDYAWDGTAYVQLNKKSIVGEVFDVSEYHAGATYADLAAALGVDGKNVPQSVRKGGMSIKFVQSSDNNYVQYRCIADEFTTDVEKWAVCDDNIYVENPEFVRVVIDKEDKILEATRVDGTKLLPIGVEINDKIDFAGNKTTIIENPEFVEVRLDGAGHILWGIQKDGTIFFGAGVPPQIIDYINEKITELSLDEYEDIVAFLDDLEKGDKTLQDLLNDKVNIEEGKSLIDAEYASAKSTVDNPEFLEVTTDSEGKLLSGRTSSGVAFENVGFSTKKLEVAGVDITDNVEAINSNTVIEDPEGRNEITIDSEGKVISYRDADGVKHENIGINSNSITLSEEGLKVLQENLNTVPIDKKWYLPDFGKVNIKKETFYLDAGDWSSYSEDVILIQMYDDTSTNALKRLTLSTFYIKNTLTPLAGGGYDRTSVDANSVALDLHAGKDVVAIDDKFFATAIYTPVVNASGYITDYTKNKATKVLDPETGNVIGYTYNGQSTEVKQATDIPPYKAWKVNKNIEHYCKADINFGTYYSKNNVAVSIKYQGSFTTAVRKKGFRLTFYKNSTFAKKDKVKIGEMVRLSGYNIKAFMTDSSRVKDPVFANLLREIWETRGRDAFPWNKDSVPFNGATGFIKSFPVETWFGEEFYGLEMFGLKKDEKNYMLDGDDDASGIFISGDRNGSKLWINASPRDWADEMGADNRELEYPDWKDSVSVSTAAALRELFNNTKGLITGYSDYEDSNENVYNVSEVTFSTDDYSTGVVTVDDQTVTVTAKTEYDKSSFNEYVDIESWIDYWIGLQLLVLYDNTDHNMILYTGPDKKKFYAFFYDLDASLNGTQSWVDPNTPLEDVMAHVGYDTSFWSKFTDEFKDSIINRYAELRKTVLTKENIENIYKGYTNGIPSDVITAEVTRWGSGNPADFDNNLEFLKARLNWLDNNYFNL